MILRFVPYIGPIIAAVLPATIAAAVSPHWSMVVWTLGLLAVAELITGQFIEPMVYGIRWGSRRWPSLSRRSSGPGGGGRSA